MSPAACSIRSLMVARPVEVGLPGEERSGGQTPGIGVRPAQQCKRRAHGMARGLLLFSRSPRRWKGGSVKPRLVEIDFVFRAQAKPDDDWHLFRVRADVLHGSVDLSFQVGRGESEKENFPAFLIEAIRAGLSHQRCDPNQTVRKAMDPTRSPHHGRILLSGFRTGLDFGTAARAYWP